MDFRIDSVALRGRKENALVLNENKSIIITSDILKHNSGDKNSTITIEEIPKQIQIISDSIDILSNLAPSKNNPQSVVFGESLVEILKWMIDVMVTHTHPPNAPPINTFFVKANKYSDNMENLILNKNVRTK